MLKGYTRLEEHFATGVQNDVPKKGLAHKWPRNKTGLKGGTLSLVYMVKTVGARGFANAVFSYHFRSTCPIIAKQFIFT